MTVINWLKEKKLNETEINFILTLIPALSVLIRGDRLKMEVMELMRSQFTAIHIRERMDFGDYQQFQDFLEENFQDRLCMDEFFAFVKQGEYCTDWCDCVLATKQN